MQASSWGSCSDVNVSVPLPSDNPLQKTIHNCSTEILTRGPSDFPSNHPYFLDNLHMLFKPRLLTFEVQHMIFQLELKYCSLQRISFLLSILPPAFPKGSTSLSPHELEAHSQLIFFISSKNGSKLNAVHYRKLSNSDDIFSSFLYRIQLQTFYLSFLKKLQLA